MSPSGLKRFRYAAGLSAPVYLLALFLLRERIPGGIPFLLFAAIGPLAAAYFFVAYLLARKRDDRVPDLLPLIAWGAAAAMEIHAFVPPVARTGVVPAALFFGLALKFPPTISIPAILCADAWLAAVPGPIEKEIYYTSAMALIAGAAGIAVRGGYRDGGREVNGVQEAIARSRALVLPWEDSGNGGFPASGEMTEESSLLRREEELKDGIRQALDRLLGLIGASHVAYIARSGSPGSVLHEGFLLSRGSPVAREISLPDTYVPVREATVFRKPFLEVGPGARQVRSVEKRSGECPRRGRRRPGVQGGGGGRRPPRGPRRGGPMEGSRDPGDGTGGSFRRARYRADAGTAPGGPVLSPRGVVPQHGPEDGGGGDGRGSGAGRRRAFEAGDGLRGDRGTGPPAGRRGQGPSGRIGRGPGERSRRLGAVAGGGGPGPEGYEPLGDSYVGWVIRTGTQRIFPGAAGPPRSQGVLPESWEREGERSFLVLPVEGRVGFRGALVCAHPQEKRFRKRHAEIARDITRVMQLGLSHVERLESLTKKATTDGLTGLSNRKAFLERLAVDLARLDGRHPCGVVMLDIDHFKGVNDTYGHPFGDEVLRGVASVLGKGVRKGDTAGRYGGEEFVLYLHMADTERAREGAERFRRMIRQIRFAHAGKEIAVTASFGVACAPHHGKGVEELLKHADEALYLSKQRGRDRVTVYPG